jgi:site-specific recombinase XerD
MGRAKSSDSSHASCTLRGAWTNSHVAFHNPVHPHTLRHATGYKLANDGQDTRAIQHYLGHRNIQHTTRYTELAADRFKDFWRD